jgi:hypothetical protein
MAFQFSKHYTRDEARALLPQIRKWLEQLQDFRERITRQDQRIAEALTRGDAGGELVNNWIRTVGGIKGLLKQFANHEIQIKDLDRGLIDFPAILGGREVFLCWEKDEEDIEFWHDLDTGYAGRERLAE